MKDGWHKVYGWSVLVENGKVIRGINPERDLPVYPYKATRNGWDICQSLSLAAFRKRMANGTITLR